MTNNDFMVTVSALAEKTHTRMMQKGMQGDYTPITVCGVSVTCADDMQSVKNRFFQHMRSVNFDDLKNALIEN